MMKVIIEGCKLVDLKSGQKETGEPYFSATVQYFGGQIRLKLTADEYQQLADKQNKMGKCALGMDYSENKWGTKVIFAFESFVEVK